MMTMFAPPCRRALMRFGRGERGLAGRLGAQDAGVGVVGGGVDGALQAEESPLVGVAGDATVGMQTGQSLGIEAVPCRDPADRTARWVLHAQPARVSSRAA